MKKICFVTASEQTVSAFLLDHVAALALRYDVSVATGTRDPGFLDGRGVRARVFAVPLERAIRPLRDLAALAALTRLFRRERFDAVHSVTPKAGLLTALGALLAGVPVRIHTFTGQVWATRTGPSRFLLKSADRLLAALATHILVDSRSQREFLVAERVIPPDGSAVLASGSICGVDTRRFRPDPEARAALRRRHGIPDSDTLFLFLGRMNRDKGVLDLAEAFSRIRRRNDRVHLMLVGPDEGNILPRVRRICAPCWHAVHLAGATGTPEAFVAGADVLCLPSYREGFGNVIIEAASAGIPAIATRIYGVVDALEDGVSGLLCEAGNVAQLADRMGRLAVDPGLRRRLGENARARARREFRTEIVTRALVAYYRALEEEE